MMIAVLLILLKEKGMRSVYTKLGQCYSNVNSILLNPSLAGRFSHKIR